jgi:hypothetical protein
MDFDGEWRHSGADTEKGESSGNLFVGEAAAEVRPGESPLELIENVFGRCQFKRKLAPSVEQAS